MPLYNIAFYAISFFLIGVFLASLKLSFAIIILISFLAAVLFIFGYFISSAKRREFLWLAGFSFIIIVGAFYYVLWSAIQIKNINIVFDEKIKFSGVVSDYPEKGSRQKLIVKLSPPHSGKILVNLQPYPSFDYGDSLDFEGVIKQPEPQNYADYLVKNGIFGTTNFPKTELKGKNSAAIKSYLFKFKEKIIANFQKVLPFQKAAFLSGITLGERAEFSPEFKEAMKKSGTTHIVALSGYNISVIAVAVSVFLGWFLNRRRAFGLSILTIIAFVFMTGAEASVVRVAIMGGIVLLAKQIGRVHSVRNAVAVSAFLMVLVNPKILRFDIGFILSFAALLGIVYLAPAIQKFFKTKEKEGFLGWRENLLVTVSAQLAVIPILTANFGGFSITSLFAHGLILEAIPLTMLLGFILGILGFLSVSAAAIFGWFIGLFLAYELAIIDIFSKISLSIADIEIGIPGAMIYYLIIIGFIVYNYRPVAK